MNFLKSVILFAFLGAITFCNAQTKTNKAQATESKAQTTQSKAQSSATTITDEDLKKFAITQDSVKSLQETLTQIITENVQQNTVMTVARYNELHKAGSDSTKLQAANATPEEISFLKEIDMLTQYNINRINTVYQALAKDYVGLKAFNAIKKSLQSDENLKARYESISQQVQSSKQTTGEAAPATNSKGK